MKLVNNKALEFDFEGEDLIYTSSLPSLWYPELEGPMSFTPKQFHFHMGNGTVEDPSHGSEHEFDGQHYDFEMHIVNLNLNEATADKFKAGVIGIMFDVDDTMEEDSFADTFFHNLMNPEYDDEINFYDDFIKYIDFNQRYIYRGSLTTPPFSELLFWTVLPTVVPIKQSTKNLFLYTKHIKNSDKSDPILGSSNRDT